MGTLRTEPGLTWTRILGALRTEAFRAGIRVARSLIVRALMTETLRARIRVTRSLIVRAFGTEPRLTRTLIPRTRGVEALRAGALALRTLVMRACVVRPLIVRTLRSKPRLTLSLVAGILAEPTSFFGFTLSLPWVFVSPVGAPCPPGGWWPQVHVAVVIGPRIGASIFSPSIRTGSISRFSWGHR